MYTKESVQRLINDKGVQPFLDSIFSGSLPEHITNALEQEGITKNGVPQLSLIYSLVH